MVAVIGAFVATLAVLGDGLASLEGAAQEAPKPKTGGAWDLGNVEDMVTLVAFCCRVGFSPNLLRLRTRLSSSCLRKQRLRRQ